MTPDFDGRRFGFPGGDPIASPRQVLRWAITRRPVRWPRRLPNPEPDPVVARVMGERLRTTFVNHASVLIQSAGLNILTDPVWSKRVSPVRFAGPPRHRAPGIVFDALPPIDAVLLSHAHYDHMDLDTLARLQQRDAPLFVVPLANAHHLDGIGTRTVRAAPGATNTGAVPHATPASLRVVELDWWGEQALSAEASVTLVPARHWSSRRLGDENRALWGGFVLRLPGGHVYFAGDTGYGDGAHFHTARERLGPFRFALLPIGAYEPRWFMRPQHMNPEEAVQAFADLDAAHAMAIHFGTFRLTDEAHDAPVAALDEALQRAAIDAARFRALGNGLAWNVP